MPPRKKAAKKAGGVNALDTTDIWLSEDSLIAEALRADNNIRSILFPVEAIPEISALEAEHEYMELPGGARIVLPSILSAPILAPILFKPPVIYDTSPSTLLYDIEPVEFTERGIPKKYIQQERIKDNRKISIHAMPAITIDMLCDNCFCYWAQHVPSVTGPNSKEQACQNCDSCSGWEYRQILKQIPDNVEEMIARAMQSSIDDQLTIKPRVVQPVVDKWKDFPL